MRMQGLHGGTSQPTSAVIAMADFAPEWDFTHGGSKLLISGDFDTSSQPLFVVLDGIKVTFSQQGPSSGQLEL